MKLIPFAIPVHFCSLITFGICCIGKKHRSDVLRPAGYMCQEMGDTEWDSIMCPDGPGQFFIPACSTFSSGHGTFGGAAAAVLTTEFGNSFAMTDKCRKDRSEFIGPPRSYPSFFEIAQENAYSRMPIGVHFQMDSEASLDLRL